MLASVAAVAMGDGNGTFTLGCTYALSIAGGGMYTATSDLDNDGVVAAVEV